MKFETIDLDIGASRVATLTLSRPEKHNSMSAQMIDELQQAADLLASNDDVRVVVLTGEGKSFCAGGDLNWMKNQFAASREERMDGARALAYMLRSFNELPKPLIGRINGQAYGGGIGLMSVCDVAVGIETAKFALTEVRLGMIPATISPYVLARMGETQARKVFFSARVFDAAEALQLNLLAKVVSAAELDNAINAEIIPYLSVAPKAVAASKKLVRRFGTVIDDAAIEETVTALADTWEGAEARHGIGAFLNKEKPDWS